MTASAQLRADTAAAHARVDAGFAGFDLADRGDYIRFLTVQGRALVAAERYLAAARPSLPWRQRTSLILADLAALGEPPPQPLTFELAPGSAQADGVVYVLEGSRLGGQLLAARVPAVLPHGYLGANHLPGEWRALRLSIDRLGEDPAWLADAASGARACFALFENAVA